MLDLLKKTLATLLQTSPKPEPTPLPSESSVELLEALEDPIRATPPILLRVSFSNESLDDTNPQFLTYGWTRGVSNFLTDSIERVLRAATDQPGEWASQRCRAPIKCGTTSLTVEAVQIVRHSILKYKGPKLLALFFPSFIELPDEDGMMAPVVGRMTGGPSDEYLALLKAIAVLYECKILTIETCADGSTLALFKPWSDNYFLPDVLDRQKEWKDNEALDGSDEPMAGSEGS